MSRQFIYESLRLEYNENRQVIIMIDSIHRAARVYQTTNQWYEMEDRRRQQEQPPDLQRRSTKPAAPVLNYEHDRTALTAARSLPGILSAAGQLAQAARPAAAPAQTPSAPAELKKNTRALVRGFNELAAALEGAGNMLRPSAQEAAADLRTDPRLEQIGISAGADGRLLLDEELLSRAADAQPGAVQELLFGPDGWASRVAESADALQSSPPAALLEAGYAPPSSSRGESGAPAVRGYSGALPVSFTGLLLDLKV